MQHFDKIKNKKPHPPCNQPQIAGKPLSPENFPRKSVKVET